jgi:hypothetical protein
MQSTYYWLVFSCLFFPEKWAFFFINGHQKLDRVVTQENNKK